MTWATFYIEQLAEGKVVQFRPRGNSMKPRVKSKQLCTVEPIQSPLAKGDVVLCKVSGRDYLHLVKAVTKEKVLIGNNRGGTNGWTPLKHVYGKLISVED